MFKKMKQKMMQKMVQSRLPKDMPPEQRERVVHAVSSNPELFEQIGKEIQQKMKQEGKDQMTATMEVMQQNKDKLKGLL